jgi:hypothetical protein
VAVTERFYHLESGKVRVAAHADHGFSCCCTKLLLYFTAQVRGSARSLVLDLGLADACICSC